MRALNLIAGTETEMVHKFGNRVLHQWRNRGETQIHAGLHKTGSTSLQDSLRVVGLLQNSHRSDFRDRENFYRVMSDASSNRLVISSEHVLGEMLDIYSSAAERFELIAGHLDQSRTILYVRPHPQWHVSAYAQLVQQGTEVTPEEYENRMISTRYFSWNQLAEDLLTISGPSARLEIRAAQNVVIDFARVIGVTLPQKSRRNESLSPLALEAVRRLNREGFSVSSSARRALATFRPESRLSTSVFSRGFQSKLIEMRGDWLQLAKTLNATGAFLADSWQESYDKEILCPVSEVFSSSDLDDAVSHIETHRGFEEPIQY